MFKNNYIAYISILFVFNSCVGPSIQYTYETGRHIDFSSGKWLINDVKSNTPYLSNKLYKTAYTSFYGILGDQLYDLKKVRMNHIIESSIKHNLNRSQLIKLGHDSECDYLINIEGDIITDNIGGINYESSIEKSATNKSIASIKIYDLNSGLLLSLSTAKASMSIGPDLLNDTTNEVNNSGREYPNLYRNASFGLNKSIRKLIKNYKITH